LKKNKKKAIFYFLFAGVLLMNAGFVYALETTYPSILGFSVDNNSSLPEYAKYFFNLGMAVAGTLAVLVLVFGGIYYLIDFARGKFANEGKEWIKAGTLGLLLILCAYLIAYTINPYLVVFDLKGLAPLTFLSNFFNPPENQPPVEIYTEIPIGKLTENLLSRQIDCYDFDADGDPIPGEKITTDDRRIFFGPTYLEHDRVDCILKLSQAADRKAEVIKKLSDEIVDLMLQCKCSDTEKCSATCKENNGECIPGKCAGPGPDCCPDGVKEIIEHGPIPIKSVKTDLTIENIDEELIWYTVYGHMDKISVSVGQNVGGGTPVGEIGEVGTNMGPHLHFAVGYPAASSSSIYDVAISFNIYSIVSTAQKIGSRTPDTQPLPLPKNVTPEKLNFIKSTISSPLSQNYCAWQEQMGSILHDADAYWAQDWICKNNAIATESAIVYNMSSGPNIKSTVISILPSEGGVVIKHQLIPPQKNELLPQYYIQTEKKYAGLDEFRSQFSQNYQLIKNTVEVQPPAKLNNQQITIINPGNCAPCIYNCQACYAIQKNYPECIAEQQKCEQQKATCEQNRQDCLKKSSPWHNLMLIDQLIYLQGRIEEMKESVKTDSNSLKSAESYLGQCYIADTYVDFLKTYEQTNKKEKVVIIDKPFYESPAKYCKGFEYNNSSCYSQCKDICPGTSQADFNCYKNASNFEEVKNCYDYRSCVFGSPFTSFYNCISVCKEQCAESCQKYLNEDEKKKCVKNCGDNSQCLMDNEDKCLVDFKQLYECADASGCQYECGSQECIDSCTAERNDAGFVKNCIENSAYKCTYCSDQYAGYPECLVSPYSLQNKYSSSFIFQHKNYQICSSAYAPITTNNNDGTKIETPCLRLYPETAKCPTGSKCPECPCDLVEEKIEYPPSTPSKKQPKTSCESNSDAGTTDIGSSKNISQYKICSGTCDDFSYNDEPLTFYCQNSWWNKDETKNTIPIGHERICPKEKEIPVGQTIDDAEKWADDLINNIDKVTKRIKDMIQYMQRIGQEKNYCKCDIKCENGDPVCRAACDQSTSTTTDSSGNSVTTVSCSFNSCVGNSCQTMIDFLLGAICKDACKKGEGIPYFRNQVNIAEKDFIIFTIEQNRSDIVKELEYSRQQTNSCSTVQNNYGAETRILSCTRVQDEIISPTVDKYSKTIIKDKSFTSYCYGKSLGEILKTPDPLADNWFCCEDRKKDE
jgi:hypothetical protein